MRITIRVKPASARPGVGGEHGALIVRVSARAVDGKATEAALTAVSDSFGVRRTYHDQAVIDAARLAMMRHTIFVAPPPRPPQTPGRVTYSQLRAAASRDPTAFRALWKINGMVCPPEQVYTDPDVIACTQETLRRCRTAPPVPQPAREQLLAALTR